MVFIKLLKFCLTLNVWDTDYYLLANRLDSGQLLSNSGASLTSNLFATQSITPHQKQAEFQVFFYSRSILRKNPSIQRIKGMAFGHMQKVYTQTSRCVSDAASDQGLHFLTLVTSIAHIFLAV